MNIGIHSRGLRMLSSDLKKKLRLKRVRNVKRLNPVFKRFAVGLINRAGRLLFIFRRNKLPGEIKKVLFVSISFYGDILLHSPLFEIVRKLYPDAELHVWIKSRTKEMIKGYPYISKVHVFDDVRTRRYDEEITPGISRKLRFFRELKKEHYDLAFDLTGLIWTAIGIYIAKPKYSSGYNFLGLGFLYNFETKAIFEGHLIDKHTNMIKLNPLYEDALSKLDVLTSKPVYYIKQESADRVTALFNTMKISADKKKAVLHTTAGWKAKTWDLTNFIRLSNLLSTDFDILLIGGKEDVSNAEEICSKSSAVVYNFSGQLTIDESAEVIRRADIFIGADSGPLYLAEAVGTKTLSLFGPTNPLFSAPRGDADQFVYKQLFCSASANEQNCKLMAGLNCRTIDCMKMIEPEEIAEKVLKTFGVN